VLTTAIGVRDVDTWLAGAAELATEDSQLEPILSPSPAKAEYAVARMRTMAERRIFECEEDELKVGVMFSWERWKGIGPKYTKDGRGTTNGTPVERSHASADGASSHQYRGC